MSNQNMILEFIQAELLSDPELGVGIDDDLLLDGVLDSLAVMRLVAFLESRTGTSIPPEDVTLENFQSVNAITAYLRHSGNGA